MPGHVYVVTEPGDGPDEQVPVTVFVPEPGEDMRALYDRAREFADDLGGLVMAVPAALPPTRHQTRTGVRRSAAV